jgi:hypothetical protein
LQGSKNLMSNPMDDEALNGAPSAIKIRSSVSEAGDRGRRIAMAEEEGLFPVDRTAWAIRWRHPLARSIEARRGKISRS